MEKDPTIALFNRYCCSPPPELPTTTGLNTRQITIDAYIARDKYFGITFEALHSQVLKQLSYLKDTDKWASVCRSTSIEEVYNILDEEDLVSLGF